MKRAIALVVAVVLVLAPAMASATDPTPFDPVEGFRPVLPPVMTLPPVTPAPTAGPILEPPNAPEPTYEPVPVPTPRLVVRIVPGAVPRAETGISGRASYYCGNGSPCTSGYGPGGSYGAAGPGLRAAICGVQSCTSWRGKTVYVDGVPVKLIDWCQCYWKQSHEKLIDLYYGVFRQVGGDVTITWR